MATTTIGKKNHNINSIKSTSNYCSQPIKIPLVERFASQISTGSTDSGVVVGTASQKTSLQSLDIRSFSIHANNSKPDLLPKLRQPASCSRLLSQDSGIDSGVLQRRDNGLDSEPGSQTHLKCSTSSSNESLGANSSGISSSKFSEDGAESENSGYFVSTSNRRLRYKNSASTIGICGTQGLEDIIQEVDIPDDYDDDDDEYMVATEAKEDDEAEEAQEEEEDDDDEEMGGIVVKIPQSNTQSTQANVPAMEADTQQKQKTNSKGEKLYTDGYFYFPLLKISDDPYIDNKLINKKDGLQDTMYYLDEFGSPKLREKFARKQKQKELKERKTKNKENKEVPKRVTTMQPINNGDSTVGGESTGTSGISTSEPNNCDSSKDKTLESVSCKHNKLNRDDKNCDDEEIQHETPVHTQSCVSWTKVLQKFKTILGKKSTHKNVLNFVTLIQH